MNELLEAATKGATRPQPDLTRALQGRPGPGRIASANAAIQAASAYSRTQFLVEARLRHCLRSIDECLNGLEELHLADSYIARSVGCRKVVAQLGQDAGVTPPEPLQSARNSYDLHIALLNWQSSVLDALIPGRRQQFPDLSQEPEEWLRPRRRRRDHGLPRAATITSRRQGALAGSAA